MRVGKSVINIVGGNKGRLDETTYTYSGSQLMSELRSNTHGSVTAALLYSYDADGSLVSVNYNGTEYYYLRNGQNDVVGLVDGSGNTVVEYRYDAWGKLISTTGSLASTLGEDNPIRYRGYYYDTETGLYYLQSRYYDPDTGRFINADDIAFLGATGTVLSRNLFVYCENNPVVLFDPTGCSPANVIGAVVGGIGGAVIGTALVKHFHLTGWKKWLVLGSITGLMAIVGWFAGPAIYAALKPIVIKAITACTLAVGAIKEWALKALGIAQRYINQALRLITQDKLRFSKTVLERLDNPDRAVPVKILLECIKRGKATPDPQGTQAVMYYITMQKNGKTYTLEVLFNWATKMILHFMYYPKR